MTTARQKRFIEEYLIDLNGTQAAIRAGYSANGAEVTASKLLRVAKVQAEIAQAMKARSDRTQITADMVLTELGKLGFCNMEDYVSVNGAGNPAVDLSDLDRDKWAAVSEVTIDTYTEGGGEDARDVKRIKFKLTDKRSALETIGRHLGMFKQIVESQVTYNAAESFVRLLRRLDEQRRAEAAGLGGGSAGLPEQPAEVRH